MEMQGLKGWGRMDITYYLVFHPCCNIAVVT